ncbi:alpha/beta fold hydrolase [Acinetobacter sp. YH12070]|uniref:alpha/beta fold hydrolase n=1 Tax=Acinetobacter sp. YH12070 TaxID=2601066 RepID=UPI0015D3D6B3|nr:alpha/beta hydrolase [Acinetobacter sp. YH12070]
MNQQHLSMVFIPGFMLDESLWDELIPQLPHTWNFFRASLKHGQTIDEIAEHILLNAPPRFVLVGFSLGGYIARTIAQKYPERISALILVASSLRPDSEIQKQLKIAAIQAASAGTFHGLSKTAIAKSLHPNQADNRKLIQRIQDMGKNLGFESFKAQSLLDRSHIRSGAIQCPTLIISAAQDRLRSLDEAQELHQSIAHSQLDMIENTGHMIPLEQPEALAASMLKWLNTLPL